MDTVELLGLAALPAWTWKGAVLLAFAGLGTLLLRRRSPAVRHLLWSGALAGALVLPLAEQLPARWRFPLSLPAPHSLAPLDTPGRAGGVRDAVFPRTSRAERPASREAGSGSSVETTDGGQPKRATASAMVDGESAAATGSEREGESAGTARLALPSGPRQLVPSPARFSAIPSWLLPAIWAVGALLALGRLAISLRGRRRLRKGSWELPVEWQRLAADCSRALGLRGPVALLGSDETEVPMAWGVLQPVVLIPANAAGWPAEQRRDALLHELAHLRRGDTAALYLAHLACVLHWFDPLAWLAARRLRAEAELACDDLVLLAGSRPWLYASHLLAVARAGRSVPPSAALAWLLARRRQLSSRIAAILDERRDRRPPGRVAVATLVAVCALVVLPLAAASPRPGPRVSGAEPAGATGGESARTAFPPAEPSPVSTEAVTPAPADVGFLAAAAPSAIPSHEGNVLVTAAEARTLDVHPVVATDRRLEPLAPRSPWPSEVPLPPPPPSTPLAPSADTPPAAPPSRDTFTFWERSCRDKPVEPSEQIERVGEEWKIRFESGNCRLHIDLRGEVRLTEDGGDIAYLSPRSRLQVIESWDRAWPEGSLTSIDVDRLTASALGPKRHVRKLTVETDRSGALSVVYWVDGTFERLDGAARNWLMRLVAELLLRTGTGAAMAPQSIASPPPVAPFTFYTATCVLQRARSFERVEQTAEGWKVRSRKGYCRLRVDVRGEVRLTEDGREIAPLAPGSRLLIVESTGFIDGVQEGSPAFAGGGSSYAGFGAGGLNTHWIDRKLIVEPDQVGNPRIVYSLERVPRDLDERAHAWLLRLVAELSQRSSATTVLSPPSVAPPMGSAS